MAIQTVEMLEVFVESWEYLSNKGLTEWTRLVRDLFDTLASDTIHNKLLRDVCEKDCMPVIEKLCERAKADPAFQKKLMQPTDGMGPLIEVASRDGAEILRYLCQQDGIEAHASNQDRGRNILGVVNPLYHTIEIIELLLAEAIRHNRPDMCRMLIVYGHADVRKVVKRSSFGRLEFKEHLLMPVSGTGRAAGGDNYMFV